MGNDLLDVLVGAGSLFTLAVDNQAVLAESALFERRSKGLGIDDHDIQPCIAAELAKLLHVATVVDEPASLFVVILHEVFFKHGKTLGYALTDGVVRHHDDELTPAIAFVEFKHRFGINVGFACASFHFDVERDSTVSLYKTGRGLNERGNLHRIDVVKQLPA